MARFERKVSPTDKRNPRDRSGQRRTGRDSRSRDSGDRSRRDGRGFRERGPKMTRVTCASCGEKCEVPFRPTSNKPVYCSDCFGKSEKKDMSDANFDIINEKLNKIMKALKIE